MGRQKRPARQRRNTMFWQLFGDFGAFFGKMLMDKFQETEVQIFPLSGLKFRGPKVLTAIHFCSWPWTEILRH